MFLRGHKRECYLFNALLFNQWCQLSTSLFVRTSSLNTHQCSGFHKAPCIHVSFTYLESSTSLPENGVRERSRNTWWISEADRKGGLITFLTAASLVFSDLRLMSCVFRQTAWLRWKRRMKKTTALSARWKYRPPHLSHDLLEIHH